MLFVRSSSVSLASQMATSETTLGEVTRGDFPILKQVIFLLLVVLVMFMNAMVFAVVVFVVVITITHVGGCVIYTNKVNGKIVKL